MSDGKNLLPGMAAISLFMLGLALVGVYGVMTGRYPSGRDKITVLILSSVFAVGGFGLMRMRRWGWALGLAASFCSMCFESYILFRFHQPQGLIWSVINLVFFLYLVRPEVTGRLR
jgi:hypothetical protein